MFFYRIDNIDVVINTILKNTNILKRIQTILLLFIRHLYDRFEVDPFIHSAIFIFNLLYGVLSHLFKKICGGVYIVMEFCRSIQVVLGP